MKTNIITFIGASAIIVALVIGFAIVRPVLAQVAATSTESSEPSTSPIDTISSSTITDASSAPPVENASTSTVPVQAAPADATATTENKSTVSAPASSVQKTPTEPPPAGLTEVHIIGTKYIDYFTDDWTTIAVPGDPAIDGNLDKPDVPIPTHAGMTWVHTTGQNLYDTPSGDLDVGDYAVQPDGSYVRNAPPFVSSTSTPAQLTTSATTGTETATSTSTTSSAASPSVPDASIPTTPTSTGMNASSSSNL